MRKTKIDYSRSIINTGSYFLHTYPTFSHFYPSVFGIFRKIGDFSSQQIRGWSTPSKPGNWAEAQATHLNDSYSHLSEFSITFEMRLRFRISPPLLEGVENGWGRVTGLGS